MSDLIRKLIANDKIRYLIAGGCTTMVNVITFLVLRAITDIPRNTCNAVAILVAIAFAYFINKLFVFRTTNKTVAGLLIEIITFIGMRLISMGIELLGFSLLCDSFRMGEFISKIIVQFVVVVANYVFSKLFVFKKNRRSFNEYIRDNYVYIMPFAVISVLMISVCVSLDIAPFGDKSLTLVDSLHQYLPFFGEYRDKLLNEGSMFYTWNLAMGSNFVSLFAYYLSSPFNYLFILVPKDGIIACVTFIAILKISLSGTTMAYFLSKKDGYRCKDTGIIAISVAYALSNYVIGYFWNFMWLDCIMILPLIILGFDRLMKDGKPTMYVLSLFYALYTNYYIGFMICIFLVLWFFVYNHKKIKKFFTDGVRFAIYSLVSGGLSAFLLVPAYMGIMSTASAGTELPKMKWYGSFFDLLKQQFVMTDPIKAQPFDGGVNLYCGTFAILALFLYLLCSKIHLWEKIRYVALLAIMLVSFNDELLNFIWHGMHNQYGIPNRFAFLFIFVLLVMAYDVYIRSSHMKMYEIISGTLIAMGYVFVVAGKNTSAIPTKIVIVTILLMIIYATMLFVRAKKILPRQIAAMIFTVICAGEVLFNAANGFGNNGVAGTSYYDTTNAVTAANKRVEELAEEADAGFYRAELMHSTVLDEVTWHNMPSVGTFCSTVLGEMTTTMARLGFYTAANEFLYFGATPFTNSIFNVRYLLKREGDFDNFGFDYVETVDGVEIYENPNPLSLGFAVSDEVKNWDRSVGRVTDSINSLARCMTGMPAFMSATKPELSVTSDNCKMEVNGNTISYVPEKSGEVSFFVSYFAETTGDYYINCVNGGINKLRIYVNGSELAYDRYQAQLFHLGKLNKGDYVTIEYLFKGKTEGVRTTTYLYNYIYQDAIYDMTYEALTRNPLNVEEYDDGYIKGTITLEEGQTMFTSIPYDEGWKLKVDGKEAEYYTVAGSFIGMDMEPGEHTVEFVYTPRGLYAGLLISGISLILLMLGIMHNTNKNMGKN